MDRRQKYPVVLSRYWERHKLVNPYCFMQRLSYLLPEGSIIASGDGAACVVSFQAMIIKKDKDYTQTLVARLWVMICQQQ